MITPRVAIDNPGKVDNIVLMGVVDNQTKIFEFQPVGFLILNGENDTQTPVQGPLLLQQKLTQLKYPDHILITYPNLGHEFHPSSQWLPHNVPMPEYVLADLYSWLESRSGLAEHGTTLTPPSPLSVNLTG